MSTPLASRKFTEQDARELNDSYNRFTGRSRTLEAFEWEWLNTPEGWGSMWLLEDTDTGKIVGHHGLIPIRFSYFGKSILTGKTENTHLHPPYAAKGVYYPFEVGFIEEARDRFDLLYTTQGSGAPGRIRLKLGYVIAGHYAHYMKVTRRAHLDKQLATMIRKRVRRQFAASLLAGVSRVVSVLLMPLFSRRGPIDRTVKLEQIADIAPIARELDEFWERNKGSFGITADRNSRYLKWRIFDNPNVRHEFLLARKHRKVVGYVITKSGGEGVGAVVDLVAAENDARIFNTILDGAVRRLEERGIRAIHFVTLSSDSFLNKALRRNGFMIFPPSQGVIRRFVGRKQQESLLMAKALNDGVDQQSSLTRLVGTIQRSWVRVFGR